MIDKLLFDDWDPWVTELRRDSRGRFARGGGGGGRSGGLSTSGRSMGRRKASFSTAKKVKPGRVSMYGRHTQTVYGKGGKRAKVQSTTALIQGHKKGTTSTAYVYKVKRGGRIGKAPSAFAAANVTGHSLRSRYKPGTPVGSKNVRYLTRGHMAGRAVPFATTAAIGRGLSANAVRRARKGKPIAAGYVVSYGAPLP